MSPLKEIPLSDSAQVILSTIKDDLFPSLNKIKDLLKNVQKCRISWQVYSKNLNSLIRKFDEVSKEYFDISIKLTTPDILFKDLRSKNPTQNPQPIIDYMAHKPGFDPILAEASNYLEILDRTLDRKAQRVNNNRTTWLAVAAIIVSIVLSGKFGANENQELQKSIKDQNSTIQSLIEKVQAVPTKG